VQRGYQLSIRSGTKENHGKPCSSWLVAGPSGCKLTTYCYTLALQELNLHALRMRRHRLSLKFILDPNLAPLFWKLLVSEFLLGVFAILLCSVSAPPVKIFPPQDVHRLLMLSAVMIMCLDLGTFSSVTFCKTPDFILLYYFYYRIIIITC
jgi:hypothetical protein